MPQSPSASPLHAIVEQTVLLSLQVRDDVLGAQLLDTAAKLRTIPTSLHTQQVGSNTSDVRASHRSASDGVRGGSQSDPSRRDINSRSQHINERSEVGEVSATIVAVGGADSADLWDTSWGEEVGVDVGIAR